MLNVMCVLFNQVSLPGVIFLRLTCMSSFKKTLVNSILTQNYKSFERMKLNNELIMINNRIMK